MLLKPENRGIDVRICGIIIRLVINDVFIRVPMVGQLAWNPIDFSMDKWSVVKHDAVP
ncbi:hypothetical protein QEN58_05910 [Halomonas alkaliantarctica]|uniref:Uncharacterized protein n=1 Tax=Halomonas alkaliantarctica TaxID=232346 RepID=A0ABY8LQ95_9GAMM|nr:hypothetical protein [Halomonas alkaliantarctica]WGI26592.1 hypothetical protein QEN58_05910 [Halomonas alkaliantarctica]